MPAPDAPASTSPPALSSFAALLERCQRPLYTFVCGIVNDDEQARDLVQDTFVDAWRVAQRSAPPFDDLAADCGIRRWLFHAAYNRAVSAWRRGRLIQWHSLDRPRPITTGWQAAPSSMEDQVIEAHALHQALATLSPADAACLTLIAVYDFTAAETGAIVGASAAAITKRYARARQRLRAAYLAQNPPPTERPLP